MNAWANFSRTIDILCLGDSKVHILSLGIWKGILAGGGARPKDEIGLLKEFSRDIGSVVFSSFFFYPSTLHHPSPPTGTHTTPSSSITLHISSSHGLLALHKDEATSNKSQSQFAANPRCILEYITAHNSS